MINSICIQHEISVKINGKKFQFICRAEVTGRHCTNHKKAWTERTLKFIKKFIKVWVGFPSLKYF